MKYLLFLFAVLLLASCIKPPLVQMEEPMPVEGWDRTHQPQFTFEITDTVNTYDTYMDLRHTSEYPYSNLYLFIQMSGPGGEVLKDTVECPLAAPDGSWYGKGLGFIRADRFQAHVLYKFKGRFPRSGTYTMTLEQAMRKEVLEGILDVGISIESSAEAS